MTILALRESSGHVAPVFARADAEGLVWAEYAFNPHQRRRSKGGAQAGEWTDDENSSALRAARALAHHKPSTAVKQRAADAQERFVARALGAKQSGDNDAVDVQGVARVTGRRFGVEVKTLMDNRNDKITMHPESLLRKLRWARKERAALHTVIVDLRSGAPRLYHRRGVGSFRLRSLTPVRDHAHLRELVHGGKR